MQRDQVIELLKIIAGIVTALAAFAGAVVKILELLL